MKRIISYSLYGNKPMYLMGAIRNAEDARTFLPGWRPRFYVGASVDVDVRNRLADLGADIVSVPGREDASAMFWRFRAFCDAEVELVLIRDSDSRLSLRETAAVEEWLTSGKDFHVMRDHPAHNCPILGGLWGARTATLRHLCKILNDFIPDGRYGEDQEFLERYVYPQVRSNALVHDSFFARESHARPFPTVRDGLAFVGEAFDENDIPRQTDREVIARTQTDMRYRLRLRVGSFLRRMLAR